MLATFSSFTKDKLGRLAKNKSFFLSVEPKGLWYDAFWFSPAETNRFSVRSVMNHNVESLDVDNDDFDSEDLEETREDIFDSLLWHDTEIDTSIDEVEDLDELDEEQDIGYANLDASQLELDFFDHTLLVHELLEKKKKRI